MDESRLLLNAYFEALYERLQASKDLLTAKIEKLLTEQVEKQPFGHFDHDKYCAYREACLAFVDERIEAYDPTGIQYTFDRSARQEAFELESQLDWYDSRPEFEALIEAVHAKVQAGITEEMLQQLSDELVKERGAYPNKSIIAGYEAKPTLLKLPDYVVARCIEEIIR